MYQQRLAFELITATYGGSLLGYVQQIDDDIWDL